MKASRVRSRFTEVPEQTMYSNLKNSITGSYYYAPPGLPELVGGYESLYENILDSTGRDRLTFRECEHYKVTRFQAATGPALGAWINPGDHNAGKWLVEPATHPAQMFWTGGAYGGVVGNPQDSLSCPWGGIPSGVPPLAAYAPLEFRYRVVDPPGLQQLIDRSLTAMLPGIRPSSSGLVNDLIELKDLKYIPKALSRSTRFLFGLKSDYGRRLSNLRHLRELAKDVSDPYLTWSFGVAPIIQDIQGVRSGLRDVEDRLNVLIRRANQPHKSHWRSRISSLAGYQASSVSQALPNYSVDSDPITGSVTSEYLDAQFNATIRYRYTIDGLGTGLGDQARALGDRLGINLNPSILWNAIPWTFILDWLIDVSQWLDQFKLRNIEPRTAIQQYCYSYKISRLSKGQTNKSSGFEVNEYVYKRVPHDPDFVRAINTSGLNLREFSLLGALGISRGT